VKKVFGQEGYRFGHLGKQLLHFAVCKKRGQVVDKNVYV